MGGLLSARGSDLGHFIDRDGSGRSSIPLAAGRPWHYVDNEREFLLRHLADRPRSGALLQGIHEAANRKLSRDGVARYDQLCSWRPIMAIGTVKWFNAQKGFGFIQPDDGSPDVFVHISAVERAGMSNLAEGQKLSFEVVTERGKKAASNLQAA
jgi:cold shock protein